jgi:hypothetical protein
MFAMLTIAEPAPRTGARSTSDDILRVLLYYDIWAYPLTAEEIRQFFPVRISARELHQRLAEAVSLNLLGEWEGFYFLPHQTEDIAARRRQKEAHARKLWRVARVSMHVIKRFPYVRGVFVSGELSKNVSTPESDIDFFVVTEPGRLWISRTLLILFKKIFLLNSRKYFCLNYFASSDDLREDERNVYVAAEVAHLKVLFNPSLFDAYIGANSWIREFFPNLDVRNLPGPHPSEGRSMLQAAIEAILEFLPVRQIDPILQRFWERSWSRRYADLEGGVRRKILRCAVSKSTAYIGDFETRVLREYALRLARSGLSTDEGL